MNTTDLIKLVRDAEAKRKRITTGDGGATWWEFDDALKLLPLSDLAAALERLEKFEKLNPPRKTRFPKAVHRTRISPWI